MRRRATLAHEAPHLAGRRLDDRERAAANQDPPPSHATLDPDRTATLVEERHVDREAHSKGVHGAAVGDQEGVTGGQRAKECKAEQARCERVRLVDDGVAADGEAGQTLEATGQHGPLSAAWMNLSPRLDSDAAAYVAQLARAPLS